MRLQADTPASLFIYFKLKPSNAAEALQRLEAMQSGLRERHPALTARLLARTDASSDGAELTWMEIYEHPSGLGAPFVADLEAALQSLPCDLTGPRHVESFTELRLPAKRAA